MVNCARCHHIHEAHEYAQDSTSLMKVGSCKIPQCSCNQYLDEIKKIDEDLL